MESCRRSSVLMIAQARLRRARRPRRAWRPPAADEASSSARSPASVVGGRELPEAEVDDPGCSIIRKEHVGQSQVAMRDAMGTQSKLSPHVGQHAVGQLGQDRARSRIDRRSPRRRARSHSAQRWRTRRPAGVDAEVAGHQRDEPFMFDGRRSDEKGRSSPRSRLDAAVQPVKSRSALRSSAPRALTNNARPSRPLRSTASTARRARPVPIVERGTPTAKPSARWTGQSGAARARQKPRRRPRRRSIPSRPRPVELDRRSEDAGEGRNQYEGHAASPRPSNPRSGCGDDGRKNGEALRGRDSVGAQKRVRRVDLGDRRRDSRRADGRAMSQHRAAATPPRPRAETTDDARSQPPPPTITDTPRIWPSSTTPVTSQVGSVSMPRSRSATKPTIASSNNAPIATTTSSEAAATASRRTSVAPTPRGSARTR